MEVANTLAYYDTATVSVQVPGINKYSIEFPNRTAHLDTMHEINCLDLPQMSN
jgi:hypothetical protein